MKTKGELKREVSRLAKRIKVQRAKLWSLVKMEEFEEAELVKNEIKVWQKQLLDTLIGSENN
jgi:protein-arginine kinase activator protein McsA